MISPQSLKTLCHRTVPAFLRAADGRKMIHTTKAVAQTDRWNSFDKFHETTDAIVQKYREGGAITEVDSIQTGGQIGSGRWIIQEAQDVQAATVDIISPVRKRLLDYKQNPWHVVQWTSGTPTGGTTAELVLLEDVKELDRLPGNALSGKIVLTSLNIRDIMEPLANKGAIGVITDIPVPGNPDALAWTKFGWGAVPMRSATAKLVGLVISQNQGKRLRQLYQRHGHLLLEVNVEVRRYVGSHDVVSGIVKGADNPQDEVWAIAHSGEPGAVDNASGVAVTVEIARILESLIDQGVIRRPRRTIRLLNAYECFGFFHYLETKPRLQTPLAGVCIDEVGHKAKYCNNRLEWHATIPMSAGFVDWIGYRILGRVLRSSRAGYNLSYEPFMSTADTLIGDPKYGFPCPWITTHHKAPNKAVDAYHSSADQVELLSSSGLETCAAGMAIYMYYLANLGNQEVLEIAAAETQRLQGLLRDRQRLSVEEIAYVHDAHETSMSRLQRWFWGGRKSEVVNRLEQCKTQLKEVSDAVKPVNNRRGQFGSATAAARVIPRRTAPITPSLENVKDRHLPGLVDQGLSPWALFWADGKRDLEAIKEAIACEQSGFLSPTGKNTNVDVSIENVIKFFRAHEQFSYVTISRKDCSTTKNRLLKELRKLGVGAGMDVMVHSSLASMGHVIGGADSVIDALLAAVGRSGTIVMPSFNHGAAKVYDPMVTPTTNGAIPDAFWRRSQAVRSVHPTHAVAAIGRRAEEICADHLEAGIWEQDSPIGKLIHTGGYILTIGVTHSTTTAHHVAEMSVPCQCNDPFGNEYRITREDGAVEKVLGLAWRTGTCPVSAKRLDAALDRREVQRRGQLGKAKCMLVPAYELWQVRRQHLRNVCPLCTIRPGYLE